MDNKTKKLSTENKDLELMTNRRTQKKRKKVPIPQNSPPLRKDAGTIPYNAIVVKQKPTINFLCGPRNLVQP